MIILKCVEKSNRNEECCDTRISLPSIVNVSFFTIMEDINYFELVVKKTRENSALVRTKILSKF